MDLTPADRRRLQAFREQLRELRPLGNRKQRRRAKRETNRRTRLGLPEHREPAGANLRTRSLSRRRRPSVVDLTGDDAGIGPTLIHF